MELPEFREKTYEKYFYGQVVRLTNICFPPDQQDENSLGFDDAFFLGYHLLWRHLTRTRASRLRRMHGISVQEFEGLADEFSKRMPQYKFNLFVQYKRPVYLRSPGASQWNDWGRSYYRYDITPHQQLALEGVEDKAAGRAVCIYASPAFKSANDLFAHNLAGTIVNASNIANVGRLRGHGRYSYVSQGFNGRGHSETVEIISTPFQEIIEAGLREAGLPFSDHLKDIAKSINAAASDNAVLRELLNRAQRAMFAEPLAADTVAAALATIECFSDAIGVTFYAIG
jgi:hypothetical protein